MELVTVTLPKDQWEVVVKAIEIACNKPEPKPDVEVKYFVFDDGKVVWCENEKAILKLTFDGETGELKSAEVLK